jgi:hypothetical protein
MQSALTLMIGRRCGGELRHIAGSSAEVLPAVEKIRPGLLQPRLRESVFSLPGGDAA